MEHWPIDGANGDGILVAMTAKQTRHDSPLSLATRAAFDVPSSFASCYIVHRFPFYSVPIFLVPYSTVQLS